MTLFKNKSVVQVLKVQTSKRDVTSEDVTDYSYGGARRTTTKTVKNCEFTTVLLVKDGELCTREFNGSWNVSDLKKWEEI